MVCEETKKNIALWIHFETSLSINNLLAWLTSFSTICLIKQSIFFKFQTPSIFVIFGFVLVYLSFELCENLLPQMFLSLMYLRWLIHVTIASCLILSIPAFPQIHSQDLYGWRYWMEFVLKLTYHHFWFEYFQVFAFHSPRNLQLWLLLNFIPCFDFYWKFRTLNSVLKILKLLIFALDCVNIFWIVVSILLRLQYNY